MFNVPDLIRTRRVWIDGQSVYHHQEEELLLNSFFLSGLRDEGSHCGSEVAVVPLPRTFVCLRGWTVQ